MRTFLLVLALVACVLSQQYELIDFTLEYTGTVDVKNLEFHLKAQSETIQTLIDPMGNINYVVIDRFMGPISYLNGTFAWVTVGESFTAKLVLSFGPEHTSQPHVLNLQTIGQATVIPAHHEVLHSIAQYNVTSGLGAFMGATGGVSVNGYHFGNGDATWVVSGVFFAPPPPPPPPSSNKRRS